MYISCIHKCIYVLSERNAHPLSSHENHCQCHVGTRANMLHRVANGKERNGNHLTCKVGVQKRSIMSWINSYNGRSPLKIKTRKKERKKKRIEGASNVESLDSRYYEIWKRIQTYIHIFVCILSLWNVELKGGIYHT